MGSEAAMAEWMSKPCIMGIDEAGRGPFLGPTVYGCLYCACSCQKTLAILNFADSKTLKEEKGEELFEDLKANESIGWAVHIIDPRELSAKMLNKFVWIQWETQRITVWKISIKFVVAKKADSLHPVVSGASIFAKVTRDQALREMTFEETAENMHRNFGSGYPGDPETKDWLEDHKHNVFGFPSLVRFSWGACTAHYKDIVEVLESDKMGEDASSGSRGKQQLKLSNVGFASSKRRSEETESSGKGRCKLFETSKLATQSFLTEG